MVNTRPAPYLFTQKNPIDTQPYTYENIELTVVTKLCSRAILDGAFLRIENFKTRKSPRPPQSVRPLRANHKRWNAIRICRLMTRWNVIKIPGNVAVNGEVTFVNAAEEGRDHPIYR